MEMSDKIRFCTLWKSACKETNGKHPDDDTLTFSFMALSNFSFDEVRANVFKHAQQSEFWPTVASINKMILGDNEGAAMQAWATVRKISTHHGGAYDIVINDPISMKAVKELGGISRLASMSDEASLDFYGNEFRSLHRKYRITPPPAEAIPKLLEGYHNNSARIHNHPLVQPIRIGFDNEKPVKLPDMSKPRYEQIENSAPVSVEKARENLAQLMSFVGAGE